ncbi:MAG: sulfotransferase [Nanoarchaeota archaeon]|nr:sulfotransferase [Nanoarchaeota archaeon]MBU1704992.1 sulfotransferase [Nanoarchaeota archaeon]
MEEEQPIFIFGVGRCGSTLLQRILNSVDNVMISGEHGGFLGHMAQGYFSVINNNDVESCLWGGEQTSNTPENLYRQLKDPHFWSAWANWFNKDDFKDIFRKSLKNFFMPACLVNHGIWGFKEVRYFYGDRVGDMIINLFPKARFIFITRNPTDVIISQMIACKLPFDEALSRWISIHNNMLQFCKRVPDNCYFVKLEDMVQSSPSSLGNLFTWLGFDLTDKQRSILDISIGSVRNGFKLDEEQERIVGRSTKWLKAELGY